MRDKKFVNDIFTYAKSVHCVGIGGIGVSAIAKMMLIEGKDVTGSDVAISPVTEKLEKDGATIYIGHKAQNLDTATDLVIYTIAVSKENPELAKAKKLGITMLTYPQALGLISSKKYTIAISGTHGKTTTTAMVAEILMKAGLHPTVVVGSFLNKEKENFIAGSGRYLVAEACEYQESFLTLSPKILVITNIDNDHLDYYKNLRNIQRAFHKLAKKVPDDGYVVCQKQNNLLQPVISNLTCQIVDYRNTKIDFPLGVPGTYNVENAEAAATVACLLGVGKDVVKSALSGFSGTWRRAEYKGKTDGGALVYDDYAHHPTEVVRALRAFREKFPDKKITVVFQPHLYSRTKLLFRDFVRSFDNADNVIVTPIYAAREKSDPSVSSKVLADNIYGAVFMPTFSRIENHLVKLSGKDDIIITMGAGDVYAIGEYLVKG